MRQSFPTKLYRELSRFRAILIYNPKERTYNADNRARNFKKKKVIMASWSEIYYSIIVCDNFISVICNRIYCLYTRITYNQPE